MLRVRAITPIHVDSDELRRRQERYDRLAPVGIAIHLDDLGADPAVPRQLQTQDDIRRSEELVVAEIRRTDAERFDAVLPDCVLDPGVGVVQDAPVPVVGLLSLCGHFLAGAGQRFAAVTRNEAIAEELRRKADSYGMADVLTEVRVLGLSVEDIADDRTWAAAVTRVVADVPVGAVFNACSAVEVQEAGAGPRIVDPTAWPCGCWRWPPSWTLVGGPTGARRGVIRPEKAPTSSSPGPAGGWSPRCAARSWVCRCSSWSQRVLRPVGNNTAMSTAMVPGAGTRWQAEAGIADSPAIFVEDILRKTHGEADRPLAESLAEVSGRLVTWLADDLGLPISLVTDFPYPGHSQFRCHTVPGRSGATCSPG